jgi:hypothetical protein
MNPEALAHAARNAFYEHRALKGKDVRKPTESEMAHWKLVITVAMQAYHDYTYVPTAVKEKRSCTPLP